MSFKTLYNSARNKLLNFKDPDNHEVDATPVLNLKEGEVSPVLEYNLHLPKYEKSRIRNVGLPVNWREEFIKHQEIRRERDRKMQEETEAKRRTAFFEGRMKSQRLSREFKQEQKIIYPYFGNSGHKEAI